MPTDPTTIDLTAPVIHWVVDQGKTWQFAFVYPVGTDLTGYQARLTVRDAYGVEPPRLALTSSPAAGLTVDVAGRAIRGEVSAADMAALPAQKYVYDCEAESAGGIVYPVAKGKITVKAEATT